MPGISTGRANPNDYVVGRGIPYFCEHDTNGNPRGGYRDLGNCTEFKINMESQDLDHMNSRSSLKFVDRQVLISQKCSLSFKLDENNLDNIALFMSGTTATVSGYNGAVVTSPTDNIAPGATGTGILVGGRWYDLFKTATGAPATNPDNDRLYDLGAVTVTQTTPSGSPALNVDYLIDFKVGRIFIIKGGSLDGASVAAVAIAVNASADASYQEARAFSQIPKRGSLKFVQVNPANNDEIKEWQFHKVQLKANGELDLLGDTWQELSFQGVAEKNTAESTVSPVCTIRYYSRFSGAVAD